MALRFVVHEHHASHLHYDFRLELENVLRSWAVPKGPSMNPSERRLAIEVEVHPLEYIDFEGIIPQGEYGAGAVVIWDSGPYELIEEKADKLAFVLKGRKLKGGFTLTLLKGRGKGNQWFLIKRKDEDACRDWKIKASLTPAKRTNLKERAPPCETS